MLDQVAQVTSEPPAYAHIPGRNARHPEGTFEAICAAALSPTTSETAAENIAWQAGISFLETGFYWEAHEVLEPVWLNARANSPERFLVHALIQLANAALKQVMGRPKASLRLCAIARSHLAGAGPGAGQLMGLDLARVENAIDGLEHSVATAGRVQISIRTDQQVDFGVTTMR